MITGSINKVVDVKSDNVLNMRRADLYRQSDNLATVFEITLGSDTKFIAQGLFSALRVSYSPSQLFASGLYQRTITKSEFSIWLNTQVLKAALYLLTLNIY